jgi:hypothetical protein
MNANPQLVMPAALRFVWALAVIPAAMLFAGSAWHMRPEAYRYRDLTQDWLSARCYADGLSIYTPHRESVPRFLDYDDAGREWTVPVNAHPPVSVLAMLPLGLLSHDAAIWAWNLASLGMLVAATRVILGPRGLHCEWRYLLAACTLLAASTPLAAQGAAAQFNPLLLLLVALAWSCDRREQPLAAGALIGLAAAIKLFPAVLVVIFVCRGRWKAVASAAATLVLLNAVAFVTFGSRDMLCYVQHVVPELDAWRSAWLNCSLAGYWSRLFDVGDPGTREWFHSPLLARLLTYATSGLLVAAVGWRAWRATTLEERDLSFAAAVVAMLLVSPVTWDHSLLLLVLPVSILWYYLAQTASTQLLLAALLVVPAFVPAMQVWELLLEPAWLPVMQRVADPSRSVVALALVTYCLLGLAAFALFQSPPTRNREPHGSAT